MCGSFSSPLFSLLHFAFLLFSSLLFSLLFFFSLLSTISFFLLQSSNVFSPFLLCANADHTKQDFQKMTAVFFVVVCQLPANVNMVKQDIWIWLRAHHTSLVLPEKDNDTSRQWVPCAGEVSLLPRAQLAKVDCESGPGDFTGQRHTHQHSQLSCQEVEHTCCTVIH